jgi:hypothetical protein
MINTSLDPAQLATQLVIALTRSGRQADQFTIEEGTSVGINVWSGDGQALGLVTVANSSNFHAYAWGPRCDHLLPIETPIEDAAALIVATLPGRSQKESGDAERC